MLAIWSLVPLPFLSPAWTSGISWFTYCWSLAWRILSITLPACETSAIVQLLELHLWAKEKPKKTVGGAKSCLESNPIPTRDAQRTQTYLVCTRTQRPHRDRDRLCLGVSWGGVSQQWTTAGAGALGMASALLEEVAINPTIEPQELTWDCGNRLLEGTNNLVCTRTQEKGAVAPQEADPDLPVRIQESLVEAAAPSAVACCRVGGTECGSVCRGPFEGGRHYLHYLHHSLASGQITGKEQSPALQHKIGLKIYRTWPRPSEQDPVSPSVSLSHQEVSISFLSFSTEGRQNENHNHRKLTNLIT